LKANAKNFGTWPTSASGKLAVTEILARVIGGWKAGQPQAAAWGLARLRLEEAESDG
jgi:hypothetical protein